MFYMMSAVCTGYGLVQVYVGMGNSNLQPRMSNTPVTMPGIEIRQPDFQRKTHLQLKLTSAEFVTPAVFLKTSPPLLRFLFIELGT